MLHIKKQIVINLYLYSRIELNVLNIFMLYIMKEIYLCYIL